MIEALCFGVALGVTMWFLIVVFEAAVGAPAHRRGVSPTAKLPRRPPVAGDVDQPIQAGWKRRAANAREGRG